MTSAKIKMPWFGSAYNLVYSFIIRYPIWRVILFFFLSNTSLLITKLYKESHIQKRPILEYESIDSAFHRAMLTANRSGAAESILVQLASEFRNSINASISQRSVLQSMIVTSNNLNALPQNIKKQVDVAIKSLKCPKKARVLVKYRNTTGVEFAALLGKNGQYIRKAKRYRGGFYDQEGIRLDIADRIPNFLKLITPAKGGEARISSGYGNRIHPIFKRTMFHAGIDIRAPANSAIHAALPGKVHKIGYGRGYGNYIILEHYDNVQTLYAHLNSINSKLTLGKQVKAGDVIGRVGKTGRATGPHLHFETRLNGKHVNPKSIKPIHPRLSKQQTEKLWTS